MLHDHAGRGLERLDRLKRRVGVDEIVERQLLALDLLRVRDRARPRFGIAIQRGALMRVLAVAQRLRELPAAQQRIRPRSSASALCVRRYRLIAVS